MRWLLLAPPVGARHGLALPCRRRRQAARGDAGDGADPLAAVGGGGQQALLLGRQSRGRRCCRRLGCCRRALTQLPLLLRVQARERRQGGPGGRNLGCSCRHAIQDHGPLVHVCRQQAAGSSKGRGIGTAGTSGAGDYWMTSSMRAARPATHPNRLRTQTRTHTHAHPHTQRPHPCWGHTSLQPAPGPQARAPQPAATPHPCRGMPKQRRRRQTAGRCAVVGWLLVPDAGAWPRLSGSIKGACPAPHLKRCMLAGGPPSGISSSIHPGTLVCTSARAMGTAAERGGAAAQLLRVSRRPPATA